MSGEYSPGISNEMNDLFIARFIEKIKGDGIDFAQSLPHVLSNLCESEIEKRLLIELYFMTWGYTEFPEVHDCTMPFPPSDSAMVILAPQFNAGNYRVDIAVLLHWWPSGAMKRIAVECDGHDFHERTKEQAQRDKKRDRDLQKLGFNVFRFTGSEIFRRGRACAQEVADYATNWLFEQDKISSRNRSPGAS